jgi:hypothetical protein
VMWGSHHYRYSEPPVMCRQDCQFLAPSCSVSWANTAGLWYEPTVMLKQTLSACGTSRQWCSSQHYRLVARADSDAQVNTVVGLWLEPAVMLKPILPAWALNRQCCSRHHCRLDMQTGSDRFSNTAGS